MAERDRTYLVEIVDQISAVDAADWDKCAGTENPFTRHAYIDALETSGSVCPATGFQPSHVILRDVRGQIAAAAPAYIKSHSEAEFGSELGWALAHERSCGSYYPKLQVDIPFTPHPGPRLLTPEGTGQTALRKRLLVELINLATKLELSSVHLNFITAQERDLAATFGMLPDLGTIFVWTNDNYQSFESFLISLSKNRRAMIRRERREALGRDLAVEVVTRNTVEGKHIDAMYEFYLNTHAKYKTKTDLTIDFFNKITENVEILFIFCKRNEQYIAGTLFIQSQKAIYAHIWGGIEEIKFLHFEINYYRAIEYAICHGKEFIDAAPIGHHKVARGFLPVDAYHAHWFRNPSFGNVIKNSITRRVLHIAEDQERIMKNNPFRRGK